MIKRILGFTLLGLVLLPVGIYAMTYALVDSVRYIRPKTKEANGQP